MEIHTPSKSLPPIDQLPLETIIEIFHISLPSDDHENSPHSGFARSYFGQLWDLRRVCKRWVFVIDGTPSFWTAVSSRIPRHINSTVLLRSSGRPLTIYSTDPSPRFIADDPGLLELMTPVRAGWRTLAIGSAIDTPFVDWLTAPAPDLEKINLHFFSLFSRIGTPLVLLGGRTKNIREVSIARVPLLWTRDMFCSLRVLKLRGPYLEIEMEHILGFVSQSPSLEILYLYEVTNSVRTPDTTHHNIALPHLHTLDVVNCGVELTRSVFRHITVPPLLSSLRVHLPSNQTSNSEPLLTETSAFFQPVLRSVHGAASRSIFYVSEGSLEWSVNKDSRDDKDPRVDLSMTGVSTSFACGWVDQTLEIDGYSEKGVELVVGGYNCPNLHEHGRLSSLGSMLCVTKLNIDARSQAVQALLQLLGGGYGFGPSAPSLPRLQELELVGSEWEAGWLLPAVRRRFSARINSPDEPPDLNILIASDNRWAVIRLFPIMDVATVMAIRGVKGVRSLSFLLNRNTDGKPAITWSDELAMPVWGGRVMGRAVF